MHISIATKSTIPRHQQHSKFDPVLKMYANFLVRCASFNNNNTNIFFSFSIEFLQCWFVFKILNVKDFFFDVHLMYALKSKDLPKNPQNFKTSNVHCFYALNLSLFLCSQSFTISMLSIFHYFYSLNLSLFLCSQSFGKLKQHKK